MNIRPLTRTVLLGLVLVAATGMSRVPPGTDAYRDGWRQGCYEGYTVGGWSGYDYFLDSARMARDSDYKKGRDDALQTCYEEARSRPKGIGPGG
jgi:hypothetical protein